jgi:hypothetical protein
VKVGLKTKKPKQQTPVQNELLFIVLASLAAHCTGGLPK